MSVGGASSANLSCVAPSSFISNFVQGLVNLTQALGIDGIDFDIEHRDGVNMCVCFCMYVCVHISMHVYIYNSISMRIYISIFLYLCVHIYLYISISMRIYMYVCKVVETHAFMCASIFMPLIYPSLLFQAIPWTVPALWPRSSESIGQHALVHLSLWHLRWLIYIRIARACLQVSVHVGRKLKSRMRRQIFISSTEELANYLAWH